MAEGMILIDDACVGRRDVVNIPILLSTESRDCLTNLASCLLAMPFQGKLKQDRK